MRILLYIPLKVPYSGSIICSWRKWGQSRLITFYRIDKMLRLGLDLTGICFRELEKLASLVSNSISLRCLHFPPVQLFNDMHLWYQQWTCQSFTLYHKPVLAFTNADNMDRHIRISADCHWISLGDWDVLGCIG